MIELSFLLLTRCKNNPKFLFSEKITNQACLILEFYFNKFYILSKKLEVKNESIIQNQVITLHTSTIMTIFAASSHKNRIWF